MANGFKIECKCHCSLLNDETGCFEWKSDENPTYINFHLCQYQKHSISTDNMYIAFLCRMMKQDDFHGLLYNFSVSFVSIKCSGQVFGNIFFENNSLWNSRGGISWRKMDKLT